MWALGEERDVGRESGERKAILPRRPRVGARAMAAGVSANLTTAELATAKVRIDDAGEVSVNIGRSLDEAAGALQARIDAADQVIVGVNKYQPDISDSCAEQVEVRRVNNADVRERQIARLKTLRETRDQVAVNAALAALSEAASGKKNLMPFAIAGLTIVHLSLIDKANKSIFAKFLDEQIKFGSKILEVGCGTGQLSNFLSRYKSSI